MSQVPANKRMSKDMLENVLLTEKNCLYNLIKKSMKKAHKNIKKHNKSMITKKQKRLKKSRVRYKMDLAKREVCFSQTRFS